MTSPREAVQVPCSQCGAPLPFDVDAPSVRCSFCQTEQTPGGAAVARLREHLRRLGELTDRAGEQLAEADYHRRLRSGWSVLVGIGLNLVMVGGGWAITLLAQWLTAHTGKVIAALIIAPIGIVALFAVMVGWVWILSYRKKQKVSIAGAPLGRARCASCGAQVPVRLGALPSCPFCEATLLFAEESARQAEALAAERVTQAAASVRAEQEVYQQKIERATRRSTRISNVMIGFYVGAGAGGALGFGIVMLVRGIGGPRSMHTAEGVLLAVLASLGAVAGVAIGWRRAGRRSG